MANWAANFVVTVSFLSCSNAIGGTGVNAFAETSYDQALDAAPAGQGAGRQ